MTINDIYWNIDTERRRRGMTSKEFCARIGISTKTWRNYKKDTRPMPFSVLEDAAQLMMMPLNEFTKGRRGL